MGGYRVTVNDIATGNRLYRAVSWPQHRPNKIDDVSYPPREKAKLNRANRDGIPVFYCSLAEPGVFYVLRAERGNHFALSEWEVTEPLWMHNLGYHQDALRRMGAPNVAMRRRLAHPIPNESKKNARLRSQLSRAFTEDVRKGQEYKYKQSIAIYERMFDDAGPQPILPNGPRSTQVTGAVYPSMALGGAADNIAIWPEFVDSSLRIKSIRYVLIEAAEVSNSSYTFLTVAISQTFSGRDIIWQDDLAPENERRRHIALESGNWVLRDGFNRIYDLH
jgi:hypothetical protein